MNTIMIREKNIDKVINCFFYNEILTQNEVALLSGLSIPSAGKILKELLDAGLIIQIDIGKSSGGRKPKRYTLTETKWAVGVIYVEKYESTLYILNAFSKELFNYSIKKEISDNDSFYQVIKTLIEDSRDKFDYFSDVSSWGVIVPGIVDLENNMIIYSKPLGVSDFSINSLIQIADNDTEVYLFRDADAYLLSNIIDDEDGRVAHIYVNDGIGFSMLKNDQLLKSIVGSLEIGHTVFLNKQREFVKIGETFNKKRMSNQLSMTTEGIKNLSFKELKEMSQDNPLFLNVYSEQEQALQILLINVLNLFNPSKIYISGKYINDFDLSEIIESLKMEVLQPFIENLKIEHTESNVSKVLKGVVRYINKKIVE